MAANITISVDNSNLFTLTNNSLIDIVTYSITRATCEGNTINYTDTIANSVNLLPTLDFVNTNSFKTYQFTEDGLYKLTVVTNITEIYYVRVTGNIEACRRAIDKDFLCNTLDDCSVIEKSKKDKQWKLFYTYRTFLYGLLNQYQQEQSIDELLSIPDADKLTICQYFCLLQDICGNCVTESYYNNNSGDCGCGCSDC